MAARLKVGWVTEDDLAATSDTPDEEAAEEVAETPAPLDDPAALDDKEKTTIEGESA